MSMNFFPLVLALFSLASTQNIIDFGLTDQLEKTFNTEAHEIDLSIHSPSQKQDYLIYPQACYLVDSLEEQSLMETQEQHLLSQEQQLAFLKSNIKQLLAVSQKIKSTKRLITNLRPGVQLIPPEVFLVDPDQMNELELLESQLRGTNSTIQEYLTNLRSLILRELNRTKQNQFDEIRLRFQLAITRSRLDYLLMLRASLPRNNTGDEFQPKVSQFFQDVSEEIRGQKSKLKTIQQLLEGFSAREELKIKISNLESQLEGVNMMIEEKSTCDEKKGEMNNRENKKEFEKIYNQLKELKGYETLNSSYCEGVARILLKQLKKILRVYNYSFACSEGLIDLQRTRVHLLKELQELKTIQSQDPYDSQTQDLKLYFETQLSIRNQLIEQISDIYLNQHELDKEHLQKEIEDAKNRIKKISDQLENPPESSSPPIDYPRIRQMIAAIQEQQLSYCQLKEEYMRKYSAYDVSLKPLEHKAALSRLSQEGYLQKVKQLRQLQELFAQTRSNILNQIQ